MSAELCEKCVHHKVCFKDKNLVGDVFVPGNPMLFDNKELWKKYEERKAKGFPCDDYMPTEVKSVDTIIYEEVERHDNCTVQILKNPITGELSVGWWDNEEGV